MSALRQCLAEVRHEADCATGLPANVSHLHLGIADRYLAGASHAAPSDRESYLRSTVRHLGRELETVTGLNAEVDRGTERADLYLGNAKVPVQWSLSNPDVADSIHIDSAFINGQWIDADLLGDAVISGWIEDVERSRSTVMLAMPEVA